jgi:hypothetical protein
METKGKSYDCISEASNSNFADEEIDTHGSSNRDSKQIDEDFKTPQPRLFLGI